MEVERRLEAHMASDEAALLEIRNDMRVTKQDVHKILSNHLAHMEPDIRETKQAVTRIEAVVEKMSLALQRNNEDTQQVKLDMANLRGDLNTKIATLETGGNAQKNMTQNALSWMWDILKIIVGGAIVAAMAYWAK